MINHYKLLTFHYYTNETSSEIPDLPGIYGWYFPLYLFPKLYNEDKYSVNRYLTFINSVFLYDSAIRGSAETFMRTDEFAWERHTISFKKGRTDIDDQKSKAAECWKDIMSNPDLRETFSQYLFEASVLLPPLYIGQAKISLKQRYKQHITVMKNNEGDEVSKFNKRFTDFMAETKIAVQVNDLIFGCIPLFYTEEAQHKLSEDHIEAMLLVIEQVLLRTACPPFSGK